MISPDFSITTVSPIRISLRIISSWLLRVARDTVVPEMNTKSPPPGAAHVPSPLKKLALFAVPEPSRAVLVTPIGPTTASTTVSHASVRLLAQEVSSAALTIG